MSGRLQSSEVEMQIPVLPQRFSVLEGLWLIAAILAGLRTMLIAQDIASAEMAGRYGDTAGAFIASLPVACALGWGLWRLTRSAGLGRAAMMMVPGLLLMGDAVSQQQHQALYARLAVANQKMLGQLVQAINGGGSDESAILERLNHAFDDARRETAGDEELSRLVEVIASVNLHSVQGSLRYALATKRFVGSNPWPALPDPDSLQQVRDEAQRFAEASEAYLAFSKRVQSDIETRLSVISGHRSFVEQILTGARAGRSKAAPAMAQAWREHANALRRLCDFLLLNRSRWTYDGDKTELPYRFGASGPAKEMEAGFNRLRRSREALELAESRMQGAAVRRQVHRKTQCASTGKPAQPASSVARWTWTRW
jgi:hypothetical protein